MWILAKVWRGDTNVPDILFVNILIECLCVRYKWREKIKFGNNNNKEKLHIHTDTEGGNKKRKSWKYILKEKRQKFNSQEMKICLFPKIAFYVDLMAAMR